MSEIKMSIEEKIEDHKKEIAKMKNNFWRLILSITALCFVLPVFCLQNKFYFILEFFTYPGLVLVHIILLVPLVLYAYGHEIDRRETQIKRLRAQLNKLNSNKH